MGAWLTVGALWLAVHSVGQPPPTGEQGDDPAPGVAAVAGLVRALATHRVVAIAEAHWLRQAGDLYVALVRDTAFQRLAPDIVIEFASRQSQTLLDRYVLLGDSLPADSLASIWRNSTKVAGWESPVYAQWLAAIRDVNRSLPAIHRMRVLAGDTKVDWSALHTPAEWAALGDNNVSFAAVIDNEVLARGHRAFVVLGSNHLMRTGTRDDQPNTTTRVERRYPGSMYVAWLYNGRPGSDTADRRMVAERWAVPSLHPLHGTWLGQIPAAAHRFEDVADAVLYLGPPAALEVVNPAPESFDPGYRRELDRRSWLEWGDSARARTFLKLAPQSSHGSVTEFDRPRTPLGRARHVWVYAPAGYPASCGVSCALVVGFDGGVYTGAIPLPGILDSLTAAGRIPPTVALLIDNASGPERIGDLANRAVFARIVGEELIPWLRAGWKVTHDPARTIITGSSAGGLAAAFLALKRPDLFGNVLSQSGAFWRGNEGTDGPPFEWLTGQFKAIGQTPVRFFLDVGSTESGGAMNGTAPSILAANRRLRDVLRMNGDSVIYFEVPNGEHAPESWRLRLAVGLAALTRR